MGRARTFLLILFLALSASACGDDTGTPGAAASGGTLTKITYLTAFGAAGRDAFAWIAQDKGYFAEAGLDVDIKLGAATGENLKTLAAGQADIIDLDLVGAIILAGQNKYRDFRAFAILHQRTLVSIIAPADGPIRTPKDLAGTTLGAATGSVNQLLFPAYAKAAGIDPASVTWVNAAPQQVPALLAAGRVDALSTFLIGRPGIEKAAGKPMTVLPYGDLLPDLYGNALITTAERATGDPELVKRFRDAALKGLQYAGAHPDEAAELVHRRNPASAVEAAKGEVTLMAPYTTPPAGQPLGALDKQRVTRTIEVLVNGGLFPAGLRAEQVADFSLAPGA
ncbi:ABC transporter substrate-binding protein [Actinoplanes sp. RD1]|uniref:ABC transporter substrate-binding protein n=1 Tax=Actinoplanes sp. RD1 TaxID=3064538 RepID=UPI002740EF12|nr:ABC transporter substrate-binding protein [Actinoplanes sp. RD1]